MKMEQTECSETLAFNWSGNNPEESMRHSKHGESLKSRSGYLFDRQLVS
jgi:hypothetical protein